MRRDLGHGRKLWGGSGRSAEFWRRIDHPAGIKTGLELVGRETGGLRKPFALLEGEAREELGRELEDAGLEVGR